VGFIMIKKVLFTQTSFTLKTDGRVSERVDGRDNAPYNRSASTCIIHHCKLNNKNPRSLDVVGYSI